MTILTGLRRTFALFKWLGMTKVTTASAPKRADLIPYYMASEHEPWHYHYITIWGDYNKMTKFKDDPWGVNTDQEIPKA